MTRTKISKIFKDSGGKITIIQFPNGLLFAWIVCKIIGLLIADGQFADGISMLSTAVLFTWAYLEITSGVNYFRKGLGLIVIIFIVRGFFS